MAGEGKFNEALQTALENLKNIVGTETIIGDPITTSNGTLIIPVSKVTVGFATGGMDYIGKHSKETDVANSFSGCGGSGVSVSPVGFLVITPEGDAKILNVNNPADSNTDLGTSVLSLLNKTPAIVDKIKTIFKKDKDKGADAEPEPEEIDLSEIVKDDADGATTEEKK